MTCRVYIFQTLPIFDSRSLIETAQCHWNACVSVLLMFINVLTIRPICCSPEEGYHDCSNDCNCPSFIARHYLAMWRVLIVSTVVILSRPSPRNCISVTFGVAINDLRTRTGEGHDYRLICRVRVKSTLIWHLEMFEMSLYSSPVDIFLALWSSLHLVKHTFIVWVHLADGSTGGCCGCLLCFFTFHTSRSYPFWCIFKIFPFYSIIVVTNLLTLF